MSNPANGARQPLRWLRREWRLVLGLVLSAICLYLALRGISLTALKDALQAAEWHWVIAGVVLVVVGTILKAWRWQTMFYPQRIPLGRTWAIFVIGQMLNAVLPARAGELGRIYFIGKVEDTSRAKALSTVVVEKIVDLTMLALSYLIVAAWLATTHAGSQNWLQSAGLTLLPLTALALGALLLFAYAGRSLWKFLRRILDPLSLRWQSKADTAVEQALAAFEVLRRWQTSALIWGLSLLIWILSALTNILIFNAFDLSLPSMVALFLIVVLMSGVAIPPLPGNIGVFPYLCQLVLSLFGIDRETALVYGLTLQIVAYLPLIVLGIACLLWENWSERRPSSASDPLSHDDSSR